MKDAPTDTILGQGDATNVGMLALCHGAYFKTSAVWKEAPVWKSMVIPQGHHRHMMRCMLNGGWFCSDTLIDDEKRSEDAVICMYAESQLAVGVCMPKNAHFPFWAREPSGFITVEGLWQ